MSKERSRKFLVVRERLPKGLPKLPGVISPGGLHMVQGYLCAEPAVRVKIVKKRACRRGFLTVMKPGPQPSSDFEYEVPVHEADEMMRLARSRIEKIRHGVLVDGRLWEVDFFLEDRMKGLILAEVVSKTEAERIAFPSWAGVEVTEDPNYSSISLAKIGAP